MPASVTLEGMTLKAVPPWIDPIVTTAESRGEISRETTDCSDSTMRAAARIGSTASWGIAPWPPRPSTSIENWSTAAIRAPRLIPIFPTGIGLQRCSPSAAATPVERAVANAGVRAASALLGGLVEKAQPARGRRAARGARRRRGRSRRGRRARRHACAPGSARRTARPTPRRWAGRPCRRAAAAAGPSGPASAKTPVRPIPRRGVRPSAASRSATTWPVRISSYASSGCAWKSRRVATRSACSSFGKSARSFSTRADGFGTRGL